MTRWMLSGFGDEIDADFAVQLQVLLALGASHVEVRSAWGTNVVDMSDEDLARLSGLLERHGVRVSAIASPIGKSQVYDDPAPELARLERVVAAARRLEARYIRLFSFYRPDGVEAVAVRDTVLARLRAFADVAERESVVLVHENEKAIYGDTPSRVLDIVESVGSSALRVAWDNANFVQVGVRPFTDGYALLRPHIAYLQVKDARAADGVEVPAGHGDGELRETLEALRDDGWEGFASLEPHLADPARPDVLSGPRRFGEAARAFAGLTAELGIELA
ncbi:sugar phosphate isomerase/epimerase family protein [Dactylosporangium sp. NPDC051485]|uniref:sugar phosphate isomerase/epimerase family protein n=1 Tax=Dactylosporangium sp. NPDC051485 TaxID=3154846 RepID=UPI0034123056